MIQYYCIISQIKRVIGQKSRFVHTPLYLTTPLMNNVCECFCTVFITTARATSLTYHVVKADSATNPLFTLLSAHARHRRNRRKSNHNRGTFNYYV